MFYSKGMMRTYLVKDDGSEHIIRFSPENWWSTDMESYTNGTPSKLNVDALEDSEVILWSKENFEHLLATVPAFRNFVDKLMTNSFNVNQNRILSNISYSAEERYQDFIKAYPAIFNRVSLHMVASYLGISRETLSRIRNTRTH